MKKPIMATVILTTFGTMMFFAQARHGGAGSALEWHEWSSRPNWVKNLDEYDWQYVFNSPWAIQMINPSMVPRSVMELIDKQFGMGGNGMVWACAALYDNGNVINIYQRVNGVYFWITLSKYWFD